MKMRTRKSVILAALIVAAGITFLFAGCGPNNPWAGSNAKLASSAAGTTQAVQRQNPVHDLANDEALGGHTLKRHVGRTDKQLADRLREERNISAASTYTDRATAESVIAEAIQSNQTNIARWLERDRHPNLVLDYDGERAVGRTLNRGESKPRPCSHAIVVLRWDGENEYHVLTSYPECR